MRLTAADAGVMVDQEERFDSPELDVFVDLTQLRMPNLDGLFNNSTENRCNTLAVSEPLGV